MLRPPRRQVFFLDVLVLCACAFLTFTLLYTPCVAAVATIKNELGSRLKTLGVVFMQCAIAWLVGTLVYQIGSLIL